jgi:hypothetical protein
MTTGKPFVLVHSIARRFQLRVVLNTFAGALAFFSEQPEKKR